MKIEKYYEVDEGLIELLGYFSDRVATRSQNPNRMSSLKTFLKQEIAPYYQVYFTPANDVEMTTIYYRNGVMVRACHRYGYIDILGLNNDEIDFLGLEDGDEISLLMM